MYTLANMQDSIKKVEATRAQRMATEPRRMTADEKDALLAAYHPDYKEEPAPPAPITSTSTS